MIKDAELILVMGRRGSGKSTRTRALISGRPMVVIFDTQDEYRGRGVVKCRNLREVGAAIAKRYARGFVISYVPTAGMEAECLHALSAALFHVQAPYNEGRDTRKLTLVVEEMDLSFPVTRLPAHLNGMSRVVNQGRHFGIEVIGVTQFPAQVSMAFRGNAAQLFIFALGAEQHQKAMLQLIGREWKERLRGLANHSCIHMKNAQSRLYKQDRRGNLS